MFSVDDYFPNLRVGFFCNFISRKSKSFVKKYLTKFDPTSLIDLVWQIPKNIQWRIIYNWYDLEFKLSIKKSRFPLSVEFISFRI